MNPFVGLRPFDYDDRDWFFGRQSQVYALYRLLDRSRFVAVVGSSGSGKSSLVRAGLLPLLDEHWEFITLRPGAEPLRALAEAVAALADRTQGAESAGDPEVRRELIEFAVHRSGVGLSEALAHVPNIADKKILLVIDQFEELFRFETPTSRSAAVQFVQILLDAARMRGFDVRALITMRSDFIGDCARFQGLPEAVSASQFLVPSLTRDQREEVIRAPLDKAGGSIEPDLVERLLNDVSAELDQLPVLQHCLMRLWECAVLRQPFDKLRTSADQDDNVHLTEELYRSSEIGGAANALSRHADLVMDSLSGSESDSEQIFRALSEVDDEGRATRRAIPFSQLVAETGVPEGRARVVLDRFRDDDCAFILPLKTEVPQLRGDTRLDVVHEALLRRWERISAQPERTLEGESQQGWLYRERDDGEFYRACFTLVKDRQSGSAVLLPLGQAEHAWHWWTHPERTPAWADRYGGHWEDVDQLVRDSLRALNEDTARRRRVRYTIRALSAGAFVIAIFAVILAVAAERERGTALITQSQYLAGRANDAADQGDAVTGALLALEAIPVHIARPDRPLVQAAQLALEGSLARQAEIQDLTGPNGLDTASFSPDDSRLLSITGANDIVVLNAATGKRILRLPGQSALFYDAEYSPDGKQIVTAAGDGTATVWNAITGKQLLILHGGNGYLTGATYSPDGRRIVAAGGDGTAHVWNSRTGTEEVILRGHRYRVTCATFSPDNKRILTSALDGTARVWDAATGKQLLAVTGGGVPLFFAAWTHDGSRFVTAGRDGAARIWSSRTGEELVDLRGHEDSIDWVAFSPDDGSVVTASFDKTARIWDARTGQELAILRGHTTVVAEATFSHGGTRIATASLDGTVRMWNTQASPRVRLTFGVGPGCCGSARLSPRGDRFVTAGTDGTRLWDARTGRLLLIVSHRPAGFTRPSFSADGTRVAGQSNDGAAIWNAYTGRRVISATCPGYLHDAAFFPDGKRFLAECAGAVRVWDARTGKTLLVLRAKRPVHSVAVSPDGTKLAAGSVDGTSTIWNAHSGAPLVVLHGHTAGVWDLAFSPDSRFVATASLDDTARVWNVRTAQTTAVLRGHTDTVKWPAFSPDGALVVTVSADKTARVWDARSGADLLVFRSDVELNSPSMTRGGLLILTYFYHGATVLQLPASMRRVLHYHCQALIDYAHKTLPRQLSREQRAANFIGPRSSDPFLSFFKMGDACRSS